MHANEHTPATTLARHWHHATHPLTRLDKLFVVIMATFPILNTVILTLDPSWGAFFQVMTSTFVLAMSWRWAWLENVRHSLRAVALVGADVTRELYEHDKIIVTRDGRNYVIHPGEARRNT